MKKYRTKKKVVKEEQLVANSVTVDMFIGYFYYA